MGAKIDLTGMIFGSEDWPVEVLYEIEPYVTPKGQRQSRYMNRCKCGNEFPAIYGNLVRNRTQSCGCKKRQPPKNKIDLTGMRFGDDEHWVEVIYETDPYINARGERKARWMCKCKCGAEFPAYQSNLASGHTTSCGCRKPTSRIDLAGQRFVRDNYWLEVICKDEEFSKLKGKAYWRCKCCCGKEFVAEGYNITSGHTTSCGCSHSVSKRKHDVTGQHFGTSDRYVEALYEISPYVTPNGAKHARWRFKCHCGNEFDGILQVVKRGDKTSCGCIVSKGESKINQALTDLHINFQRQQVFESCRNPKTNALLRFDFDILDGNIIFEFDGLQHEKATSGWNTQEKHEDVVYRDSIKNRWCKENNKQLIRIPYTELPRIDAAYMLTLMRLAAMEEDEELVCPA